MSFWNCAGKILKAASGKILNCDDYPCTSGVDCSRENCYCGVGGFGTVTDRAAQQYEIKFAGYTGACAVWNGTYIVSIMSGSGPSNLTCGWIYQQGSDYIHFGIGLLSGIRTVEVHIFSSTAFSTFRKTYSSIPCCTLNNENLPRISTAVACDSSATCTVTAL